MSWDVVFLLLTALAAINAITVAAFSSDKRRAIRGDWRIPERTLLGLALMGGSPGAIWARSHLRHKTRKQPFSWQLDLIGMMHVGIVLGSGVLLF